MKPTHSLRQTNRPVPSPFLSMYLYTFTILLA